MKLPRVSVVIPTYNEEKNISKLLHSLMKSKYPKKKLEIIVSDDGSTDRTVEIASKYPVKILKGRHKGVGHARNLGWKSAKGDVIIFLDADMIVNPSYINEIIKPLKNTTIAGVDNREKLLNKKSLMAKLFFLRKILSWKKKRKILICRAINKKVLKEVGGIDPDYGYFDDQVLGLKVWEGGYKIVKCQKAVFWHKEPENLKELWRQSKWIGKSIVFSFKDYKKMALKRILFPLLCTSLPFYIFFIFLPLPFWFLGSVGLILFLTIEIQRSVEMYRITKWKESFLTPFFDFISMSMVCLGIFIGLTSGSKPKV